MSFSWHDVAGTVTWFLTGGWGRGGVAPRRSGGERQCGDGEDHGHTVRAGVSAATYRAKAATRTSVLNRVTCPSINSTENFSVIRFNAACDESDGTLKRPQYQVVILPVSKGVISESVSAVSELSVSERYSTRPCLRDRLWLRSMDLAQIKSILDVIFCDRREAGRPLGSASTSLDVNIHNGAPLTQY
ncbi:hypothetical protein J6590_048281 [Homalodisca vitripennis]|nr:hypothetical protein J6590_048281 [Homalodisca vitripennis]